MNGMNSGLVEPMANTPSAPPVVEPLTPSQGDTAAAPSLPDELLQIPAMQALIAGSPPAVSARIEDYAERPEAKLLIQNKDLLLQAGMNFYRSLAGDIGVIFNQLHVHPGDLEAADRTGRLLEVAPPIEQVDELVSKSGMDHPALNASVPGGPAMPQFASGLPVGEPKIPGGQSMPPMSGSGAGLPASAQRRLLQARVMNAQPGGPTSGAAPGAGRMLNQVLKQVV